MVDKINVVAGPAVCSSASLVRTMPTVESLVERFCIAVSPICKTAAKRRY